MVHLPPTCPKCGSHRTEVVDRSQDGRTLTVRCNSCGERTSVEADERAVAQPDPLTLEADAIHVIGSALSELPDNDARVRVLRWANERFGLDGSMLPAGDGPFPAGASDSTLLVGDLQEFFETPRGDNGLSIDLEAIEQLTPPAAMVSVPDPVGLDLADFEPAPAPVDNVLEFPVQKVHAMPAVAVEMVPEPPATALALEPAPIAAVAVAEATAPALPAAEADADFEATVHSFIADLQRLARDWETVFVAPDGLAAAEH